MSPGLFPWSKVALWGLLLAGVLVGCGREAPPQAPVKASGQPSNSTQSAERRDAAPKPTPPGAPKILLRLPDFELVDQQGQPFGTAQLRGRVWIANFFFTLCQSTCPIQKIGRAHV